MTQGSDTVSNSIHTLCMLHAVNLPYQCWTNSTQLSDLSDYGGRGIAPSYLESNSQEFVPAIFDANTATIQEGEKVCDIFK